MMRHARARVFRTALQILLAELGDGNFLDIALGDRMMLAMMSMVLGPLPASSGACLHCCDVLCYAANMLASGATLCR
jgi:hypothetical protein